MSAFRTRNQGIESDVDALVDLEPNSEATPLIRLWASVMHRGLRDFAAAMAAKSPETTPIIVWFWSDRNQAGSFVWLCELFGWCPDQARNRALSRLEQINKE